MRRLLPWVMPCLAVPVLALGGAGRATGDTTTTIPGAVSPAVTTIPEGCPPRPVPQAVFVGTARRISGGEVAFEVAQLRAGSLEGFATGSAVTVAYGSDARFLSVGTTYIVGVAAASSGSRLVSSVREDTDNFGGAAVVGVTEQLRCPVFENPTRTLSARGTVLESGVASLLGGERGSILIALLAPTAAALAALYAVAAWARSARSPRVSGRQRRGV